jgi:formate dehydrogenase major subunit
MSEFAHRRRAPLQRIEYLPSAEQVSDAFPLLLSTGRSLYQFNAGTMTMRTRNVKLRAGDSIDISTADAGRFGVRNGQKVSVRSRYGATVMTVRVTDELRVGQAFATFHDPRSGVNRVTSPLRDGIVNTPEYKVTAVSVEPLA